MNMEILPRHKTKAMFGLDLMPMVAPVPQIAILGQSQVLVLGVDTELVGTKGQIGLRKRGHILVSRKNIFIALVRNYKIILNIGPICFNNHRKSCIRLPV